MNRDEEHRFRDGELLEFTVSSSQFASPHRRPHSHSGIESSSHLFPPPLFTVPLQGASISKRRPVSPRHESRPLRSSPLTGPALSSDGTLHVGSDDDSVTKPRYKPSRISSTPNLRSRSGSTLSSVSSTPSSSKLSPDSPSENGVHGPPSTTRRRSTGKPSRGHSEGGYRHDAPPNPPIPLWALQHTSLPPSAPSTSRDPSQNWLSTSAYDATPKFSRLSLASADVVLPVAARKRNSTSRSSSGTSMQSVEHALPNRRSRFVSGGVSSDRQLNAGLPYSALSRPTTADSNVLIPKERNNIHTESLLDLTPQTSGDVEVGKTRSLRKRLSVGLGLKSKTKVRPATAPLPSDRGTYLSPPRTSNPNLVATTLQVEVELVKDDLFLGHPDISQTEALPSPDVPVKPRRKITKVWRKLLGAKSEA